MTYYVRQTVKWKGRMIVIKKIVTDNMVRFESNKFDIEGKVELLEWVIGFTLKHKILSVSENWVKPRMENGHTYYYSDYYGKHYKIAKEETI